MTPLVDPQGPLQAIITKVPLKPSIMGAFSLPLPKIISMATLIPILIMAVDTETPMVEDIIEKIQVEEEIQEAGPTGVIAEHFPLLLWVLKNLGFPYPCYPSQSKCVFFVLL